jgi:hypothetical protein
VLAVTSEDVSAWATVAAVIVALGGPLFLHWYRRRHHGPKLALESKQFSPDLRGDEPFSQPVALALSNSEDRYMAENVEIFVSGTGRPTSGDMLWHLAEQAPIPMGEVPATSVPPNFSRTVLLAWLRERLDPDELDDLTDVGHLATPNPLAAHSLRMNFDYNIHVAVTGSNFNALFWAGTLSIRVGSYSGGVPRCEAEWSKPLRPTRQGSS